jgi:flavodoxin
MKTLVVFDSVYGNTAEIAKSIGAAIGKDAKVVKASEAGPDDLKSVNLLIVGSPTYGGRPTPGLKTFLDKIQSGSLKNINVAAFDTRAAQKWVKIFGYAAGRIEKTLTGNGGIAAVKPEGFFVTGTKGPLADGESKRAGEWAKATVAGIKT